MLMIRRIFLVLFEILAVIFIIAHSNIYTLAIVPVIFGLCTWLFKIMIPAFREC
jgi:hypothetical protein